MGNHLSILGSQTLLAQELHDREQERLALFQRELAERQTTDILDRALLKAENSRKNGAITAAEYHRVHAKVMSLKKLKFTDGYERL